MFNSNNKIMETLRIISIALLLMVAPELFAQTHYVKSGSGLNLRSGPGGDDKVVTGIPGGAEVKVLNTDNDEWWEVEYEGNKGYVSSKFLIEDESEAKESAKAYKTNTSSSSGKASSSSSSLSAGNWGLGLRLGDPSGITAKKYMDDGKALELSVGRTAFWGVNSRYRDRFDDIDDFDYDYYDYEGYRIKSAIAIQVHYLFHDDLNIEGVSSLQWYYGFGGQVRFITVAYNYRYGHDHDPDPDDWDNHWHSGGEEARTDFDVGADGVIGVEYTFKNPKFSMSLDITLFMELLDNPFLFNGQSGIGARYNF